MTDHVAYLDLAAAFAVPEQCPNCQAPALVATVETEQPVFCCTACGQNWRLEFGRFTRVERGEATCGSA